MTLSRQNLESDYVLVRSQAQRDELIGYQSVLFLAGKQPPPYQVEELAAIGVKGFKLVMEAGDEQWLYLSAADGDVSNAFPGGSFQGMEAVVRQNRGKADYARLVGEGYLRTAELNLEVKPLLPAGTRIAAIDRSETLLRVMLDRQIEGEALLEGATLRFDGAELPRFFMVVSARTTPQGTELVLDGDSDLISQGSIRKRTGNSFVPSAFSGKGASLRDVFDPQTGIPSNERRYVDNSLYTGTPVVFYDSNGNAVMQTIAQSVDPSALTITVNDSVPDSAESYTAHLLFEGMTIRDLPWVEAFKQSDGWLLRGPARASITTD